MEFKQTGGFNSVMRRGINVIAALTFLFAPAIAAAETLQSASSQLATTSAQNDDLEAKMNAKASQAATLSGQVAAMNAQINDLNARIAATNAKIAEIKKQMAAKQAVLNAAIKEQYVNPQPEGLALVVSSGSISEVMDKQQYLQATQDRISDLLADVQAVKKQYDDQNAELAKEEANVAAQRDILNKLLADTRGEQARYAALLAEGQAAAARLTRTIATLSGNGPMQSKGYVTMGTVIGREGSTGNSTGAHTHFSLYQNGTAVNPSAKVGNGKVMWPLSGFTMTQPFGCSPYPFEPYNASCASGHFHDGIDMDAGYGAPLMAACSGNIIMNGWQNGGFGHYIVIDCGGGLWALTGHMQ